MGLLACSAFRQHSSAKRWNLFGSMLGITPEITRKVRFLFFLTYGVDLARDSFDPPRKST
jgi:hypothetical protein